MAGRRASACATPTSLCETLQANLTHEASIYQHLDACLQDFFRPPSLRTPGVSHEQRRDYYARVWDKLLIKWRDAAAIQQAFADGAPLEHWRTMLNELYDLKLSQISPQYERLRNR